MKTLIGVLVTAVVLSGCGAPSDRERERPKAAPEGEEVGQAEQELLSLPDPTPVLQPVQRAQPITLSTMTPLVGFHGTVVAINGTNFLPQPLLRHAYRFSNDSPTSPPLAVTILSGTQIRVTVPAGSFGGRLCLFAALTNVRGVCTTSQFTVGDPNGRLRITNNAQTDLITARINNQEWLTSVISPAGFREFHPVTPGAYSYSIGIGFGPFAGPAANREICAFNSTVAAQVVANATTTVVVPALNIPQLLGHCGNSDYNSTYLDDNGQYRTVTLRFIGATNRWEFREGNTLLGSGTVSTVSFAANSPAVTFNLTGAGWGNIVTSFPYDNFVAGPASDLLQFSRVGAW